MTIFDILTMVSGLTLFLYGMETMSDTLKKSAGSQLKTILAKMTSNPARGFLLGFIVTLVVQSSSATTVMIVGFVNSGTMTLYQSVGIIMGANVASVATTWLTALSGLGKGAASVSSAISWLKPSSWMPILALIGIIMIMFSKRGRKRDVGAILMGFSILMVGMEMMSGAVSGLNQSESFRSILVMFQNPIFGVLAGLVLTAIIQSSAASVGILQSLSATGAVTFGAAIPIIMGQNIGTCVTAMLSSIGASKNGRRAALVHLYFNVFGTVLCLIIFYVLNWIFRFEFVSSSIDMWGIASVHSIFNITCVIMMAPFSRLLAKLAILTVPDRNGTEELNLLDERLLDTPSVAVQRADEVTRMMAIVSCEAMEQSLTLLNEYDAKVAEAVRAEEEKVDQYEDSLGTYLVRLCEQDMVESDSREITKLLHLLGDFERISDHAVNIVESAEEIQDKKIEFSSSAKHEIEVISSALKEIVSLARRSFVENDLTAATTVEPLEQVVDYLRDQIKLHHILRLQKNECTIEYGFVLNDMLTNFERIADHCSNIAGCMIEISQHDALEMHKYLDDVKHTSEDFDRLYHEYKHKYVL